MDTTTTSAIDMDMKTNPEQDSLTLSDHNLDKDIIKERSNKETNSESSESDVKNEGETKTLKAVSSSVGVDELESKTESAKIPYDENNNDINGKGVDAADLEPPQKPLHGILSTSKNRLGNGRMESPEHDTPPVVPAPNATEEEPGKVIFLEEKKG